MSFGLDSFVLGTEASSVSKKRAFSEISEISAGDMPAFAEMAQSPAGIVNHHLGSVLASTPKLALTLTSGMEGKAQGNQGKGKEDEYESRSGSDNMDGNGSADDQDDNQPPRKKRYHRHTPQQIQEMEALFKECPHPDEKQRQMLSKQLGLAPRQIKFWFQNRRTQMKTQHERHENTILKQENEKLKLENLAMREAMRSPICTNCGGPAVLAEMTLEEQHLRMENARLKEELQRALAFTGKIYVRPSISAPFCVMPTQLNSSLELAVSSSSNEAPDGLHPAINLTSDFLQGFALTRPDGVAGVGNGFVGIDRSIAVELAVAGMQELLKMAQNEESLWVPSLEDGTEALNYEEYVRLFPRAAMAMKPISHKINATRHTDTIMVSAIDLVETLMDADRFAEMFPGIVSKAATLDVLSGGVNGTMDSALHLMYLELQVLSPLVPTRELQCLRFCQQQREGEWAVVDVSSDCLKENSHLSLTKFRRCPSGCLIQELSNGFCKVTWVEHTQYDDGDLHHLYRTLVNSGMAFGAFRWLATLQRQCERLAVYVNNLSSGDPNDLSPAGRRSLMKLAQRMTSNFCAAVSASSGQNTCWRGPHGVDDDIVVTTRKVSDQPGEQSGLVLSAATSVWLPVSCQRLFLFLKEERYRNQWDILSSPTTMRVVNHITKGKDPGNSISVLSGNGNGNVNSAYILQECCTDPCVSLVVYAPVHYAALGSVMNGADVSLVSVLPSGFAIVPEPVSLNNTRVGGSLLTIAFQMLVPSLPSGQLLLEEVSGVKNLMSCTVQRIKTALQCPDV